MAGSKKGIKVHIMQREFTIACRDDEAEGVLAAAQYLDEQMQAIASNNQALGADRCAIMAALNISHELLEARKDVGDGSEANARIEKLHDQIDGAMDNIRQVVI